MRRSSILTLPLQLVLSMYLYSNKTNTSVHQGNVLALVPWLGQQSDLLP
jgi:hypothetical protein